MDKYIAQETDPTVKAERGRQVAGQINADVMSKVDPTKMSANPVKNQKMLSNLAGLKTGAEVSGQGAERTRELMSTENIVAMGRGEQAQATAGLSDIAGLSVSEAIKAEEVQQEEIGAEENMIGSVAGMVGAGALKYGQGTTKTTNRQMSPALLNEGVTG